MGRFFSDPVEQALEYIYYDLRAGKGAKGMLLLKKAVSAGNDGDACCLLAQCLRGRQHVWTGHRFPKDDTLAQRLLCQSVQHGSALGMLIAIRCGELRYRLQDEMTTERLKKSFDIVIKKAEDGEPYCQYIIGNAYLQHDFMYIEGKTRDSFSHETEFNSYMKENIAKCENWFRKAFRHGIFFAADSLNRYYTYGSMPYVPPAPEKANDLLHIGAEAGCPVYQYLLAGELEKAGQKAAALRWYKAAAEGGEPDAWYHVGRFYEEGDVVPKDLNSAIHYYEIGESHGEFISRSRLDTLLYRGR